MSKFKLMFFSVIATAVLISLSSATAYAQYSNPTPQQTQHWREVGPCRDPWVSSAVTNYKGVVNGVGNFGECNAQMYNNGSWNSYQELFDGVKTAFQNMRGNVTISKTTMGNGNFKIVTDGGSGFVETKMITSDGASVITNDGATVIASGGGNFSGMSTTDGNEKRIKLGKSVLIIKKK